MPPSFLPDWYASEPNPRSWRGTIITLIGIAGCGYMLATTVLDWVAQPVVTNVELTSIAGEAFDITIRCNSPLGCHVEHLYDDTTCGGAITAQAAFTLQEGEEAQGQVCASPLYADGLLVAVPLGAVALSAAVDVRSGNTFVGLPPAPLLTNVLTPSPTAIGVSLSTSVDVNGNSTAYWGFTQQAASEGARCAQPPGASVGGSPAGALTSTLGTPGSIGSLCYVLRLENTATEITQHRSFTLMNLFNEWGGAYGFVFGAIGLLLFWVEQVEALLCFDKEEGAKITAADKSGRVSNNI